MFLLIAPTRWRYPVFNNPYPGRCKTPFAIANKAVAKT
jgi:hypothetical protein